MPKKQKKKTKTNINGKPQQYPQRVTFLRASRLASRFADLDLMAQISRKFHNLVLRSYLHGSEWNPGMMFYPSPFVSETPNDIASFRVSD